MVCGEDSLCSTEWPYIVRSEARGPCWLAWCASMGCAKAVPPVFSHHHVSCGQNPCWMWCGKIHVGCGAATSLGDITVMVTWLNTGGGDQRIAGMISYLHMHCMKQSFLVPHISFKGIIYRGLIFVQEANKRHYDFWASVVLSFVFSPDLWGSLTPFPQNKNKKQSSGG